MTYTSLTTQVTRTPATAAWANQVKANEDDLDGRVSGHEGRIQRLESHGFIGSTHRTTASTSTGTVDVDVIQNSVAITAVSGGYYRVYLDTGYSNSAGAPLAMFSLYWIAGTTATLTGATRFYRRKQQIAVASAFDAFTGVGEIIGGLPSGNVTIMAALNVHTGTGAFNGAADNTSDLMVEWTNF